MAKNAYVTIKKNDFKRLKNAAPGAVNKALRAIAIEGVNIAKLSMLNSPASGRVYTRGGVKHKASSPGNPPRPDTATLLNSMRWEEVSQLTMDIIAATAYAYWLEFGNDRGLAPRPFMGPMAQKLEQEVISKAFDKFLEEA